MVHVSIFSAPFVRRTINRVTAIVISECRDNIRGRIIHYLKPVCPLFNSPKITCKNQDAIPICGQCISLTLAGRLTSTWMSEFSLMSIQNSYGTGNCPGCFA